jgi:thiol-disulfide isomerase/thioredoxin
LEENIAKLEKENADLAEFLEVNIEEADEDFVADSGIRNIPVLQYYKGGELIDKTVGLITEAQLIDNIKYLK